MVTQQANTATEYHACQPLTGRKARACESPPGRLQPSTRVTCLSVTSPWPLSTYWVPSLVRVTDRRCAHHSSFVDTLSLQERKLRLGVATQAPLHPGSPPDLAPTPGGQCGLV